MLRCASLAAATLGTAALLAFPGTALAQDRDCPDFSTQQEAQDAFEEQAGDPERLDADDDNVACESLDDGGESAPADDASGTQGEATGGDEDSGAAPAGGVETGRGGMAHRTADVASPAGLAGAVLLIAGGVVAHRRRMSRSE